MHASQDPPADEAAAATPSLREPASSRGAGASVEAEARELATEPTPLRPLQLVSLAGRNAAQDDPQPSPRENDPSLLAANRLLERELADVDEEVAALQELLEEIPSIFERKFQQRLGRVIEEQRQLEAENRQLWSRLRALAPGAEITLQPPRGLLPPGSSGAALRLERQQQEAPEPQGCEADPTATQP